MREEIGFELTFESDSSGVLKETEDRIKGISKASVEAGDGMGVFFDATKENLLIQKEYVADLEKQLKKIDENISKAAPGKEKHDLLKERSSIVKDLEAEKEALDKLEVALKNNEDRITGISKASKEVGGGMEMFFDATKENLLIQKEYIADLEKQLKNLEKTISDTAPGKEKHNLLKERSSIVKDLEAEKQQLARLEFALKNNEDSYEKLTTSLRKVQDEMARLDMAGNRNSDRYRELSNKAGEYANALRRVRNETQVLARDERFFQGMVQGVSALAGGFSAVQGAIGLFSTKSENLNKIMLRVQSLMAVTIGLQQISQTLNKSSAFSVAVLTRAKEMWAAVNNRVAVSLGITTAASKALMASLTMGLSVVITGIVALVSKLISKMRKSKVEVEEFNKSAEDGAAHLIASLLKLSESYKSLGDNLKEKEEFIYRNKKAFEELGLSVNSVYDAERALVSNTDSITKAILARAKSAATYELLKQKAKEYVEKKMELDSWIAPSPDYHLPQSYLNEREELVDEVERLEQKMKQLENIAKQYDNQASQILNEFSTSADTSISALRDKLSQLNSAYESATDSVKRQTLLKEIRAVEKEIDRIDQRKQKKGTKIDTGDSLGEFKKEVEEELSTYQNAIERLTYLRDRYNSSGESVEKRSFIADLIDREKEEIDKKVEELSRSYIDHIEGRSRMLQKYVDNLTAIDTAIDIEPNEDNREKLQSMRDLYSQMYELGVDGFDAINQLYEQSLFDFGSFNEKKLAISKKYDKQIYAAELKGNEELSARLKESREKEIDNLVVQALESSKALNSLFTDLKRLSDEHRKALASNLRILIDWVEQHQMDETKWNGPFQLDAEAVERLKSAPNLLEEIKKIYSQLMSFSDSDSALTKLSKAFKALEIAKLNNDFEAIEEASKAIKENLVEGILEFTIGVDLVSRLMGELGVDQQLTKMVSQLTTLYNNFRNEGFNSPLTFSSLIDLGISAIGAIFTYYKKEQEQTYLRWQTYISILENEATWLKELYGSLHFTPTTAITFKKTDFGPVSIEVEINTRGDAFAAYKHNLLYQLEVLQKEIQAYKDATGDSSDPTKMTEYANRLSDLYRQIASMYSDFASTFGQMGQLGEELADSLFDPFLDGVSAVEDWGDAFKRVISSAIKDAFKSHIIATYLQDTLDFIDWAIADTGGEALTDVNWLNYFQELIMNAYSNIEANMGQWEELFNFLNTTLGDSPDTHGLQSAIKQITSQEAGALIGQINAMRIIGYDQVAILREQLSVLFGVKSDTAYIRKIYERIFLGNNENNRGIGL